MPGSLKLCYGESDMRTLEFICRAAADAALAGHTFYTHTAGSPNCARRSLTRFSSCNGSVCAFRNHGHGRREGGHLRGHPRVGRSGDNALVISPAYAIFTNGVIMSGGEPRAVPLTRHGPRSSSISIGCAPPSTGTRAC